MNISTGAVDVIARVCLVAMFPFSAIDKVWHWRASLAQTETGGLPFGKAMLVAAIIIEFVTPICIVMGYFDRAAAALLAGFCVITALLYHPFWRFSDFWSDGDNSVGREHFWQFLKNFGLVGGLLLIVFAGSLALPSAVVRVS